jgi:MerR family transcriptional regulator, copper efflux regulator
MNSMTISQLADQAGINTSTVRYYERAGLVPDPQRSANGYRRYTPDHATRLSFITRARTLGLSIEQIAEMLGIWDGTNCATTRAHLVEVIDTNLIELHARINELQTFATDLTEARAQLENGPDICEPGLACCTPDLTHTTAVNLTGRRS